MKLLKNLFLAPLEIETTQNKYISVCQCCWCVTNAQLHNILDLTLQPTDRYGFTLLNVYQLLNG
jgi:hypothetical protein